MDMDDWNMTWEDYDAGKDEDGNLSFNDKTMKKFVQKSYQVIEKVKKNRAS